MSRFRYRRRSVPRDPHWITASRAGMCASGTCVAQINPGDRVFHYPNSDTTYCTACSGAVGRRAEAELADEDLFCVR
jgi:hypothetical protein